MTRNELVTKISEDVSTRTSDNQSNASLIGGVDQAVLDYIQPYKKVIFDLEISGSSATATYLQDDFPDATKTFSIPSTGKIRVTGTGWAVLNKTEIKPIIFDNGGQMYFGVPIYDSAPFYLDIDLRKYDNTQSSTPSITLKSVEIRVYP